MQFVLNRGGGIVAVARKIRIIFKLEGWGGIIPRIVYIHRNNYVKWVRTYDTPNDKQLAVLQQRSTEFTHTPVISVILPVVDTNLQYLQASIDSVISQIYPHWQLYLTVDQEISNPGIIAILNQYTTQDERIRKSVGKQNLHLDSDWLTIISTNAVLSKQALFWLVATINEKPGVSLIYSDEDKIDKHAVRMQPNFKCAWNLDLFYSQNYLGNLCLLRSDIIEKVKGCNWADFKVSYNFLLLYLELIDERQICHVPRVLYHLRNTEKQTVQVDFDITQQKALKDCLQRRQVDASVDLASGGLRLRYKLPSKLPLISLIIPTRNGLNLIRQCVSSILVRTTYANYEILIIDNGSDDPEILKYFNSFAEHPFIRVIRDNRPFNFSALMNAAIPHAKGELIGLINNDIEVINADWLAELASHALRPDVGAVGARLWYPDDTIQHGGVILGLGLGNVAGHFHLGVQRGQSGYFGRLNGIQSLSAVTAACLVIRKSIYEEVGGMNEDDLQVAFNDVDFCLRVRAVGYKNIWTPYAELYHYESASRGLDDNPEKQARYAKEVAYMKQHWSQLLLDDPAYNPNLSLTYADFSLAWPSRVKMT